MGKKLMRNQLWRLRDPNQAGSGATGARENHADSGEDSSTMDPEVIERARLNRAKRLAEDPNYPSEEITQALAEMLARHWYS